MVGTVQKAYRNLCDKRSDGAFLGNWLCMTRDPPKRGLPPPQPRRAQGWWIQSVSLSASRWTFTRGRTLPEARKSAWLLRPHIIMWQTRWETLPLIL